MWTSSYARSCTLTGYLTADIIGRLVRPVIAAVAGTGLDRPPRLLLVSVAGATDRFRRTTSPFVLISIQLAQESFHEDVSLFRVGHCTACA